MSWLTRVTNVFRSGQSEADLDDELRFHIELRTADLMRSGVSREAAELLARRELGNTVQLRESIHEVRTASRLESLLNDFRFGMRMLLKNRTATFTAIVSLAVAIGACTVAFTVIDALILRPLPVVDPGQLVDLSYTVPAFASPGNEPREALGFSYPLFKLMRDAVHDRADMFVISYRSSLWALVGDSKDQREKIRIESIDGDGLRILGVKPVLGRLLQPGDDVPTWGHAAAVVSEAFWKGRFAGRPDVIGQSITYGRYQYTIVGVLEERFTSLAPGYMNDVWVPAWTNTRDARQLESPETSSAMIWARLHPGVTAAQLQPQLQSIFTNFTKERVRIRPLRNAQPEQVEQYVAMPLFVRDASAGQESLFRLQLRRPLWMVALICGLLLLLACSNVATLSFARACARASEMALRTSLGAGRSRLMQQLLVESAQIAGCACVAALFMASLISPWIVAHLGPTDLPAWLDVSLNVRTFAFAAGISVVTVLLCGVIPALYASSASPAPLLKTGESRISPKLRVLRLALTAQIAFSVTLLFLSGLLLTSLRKMVTFDLGFAKENIAMFDLQRRDTPNEPLEDSGSHLLTQVLSLPGVKAAGISQPRPMGGDTNFIPAPIVRFRDGENETVRPYEVSVSRGFFNAMGVRWIAGRDFSQEEMEARGRAVERDGAHSVIVNQAFVDKFLHGQQAIGQTFEKVLEVAGVPYPQPEQIIGVVGNFRYNNFREAEEPSIYSPMAQINGATLSVRTTGNPAAMIPSIRSEVRNAMPNLTVAGDLLLETQLDNILISERLLAWQAGFFSIVCLVLAGVGLYGVLTYVAVRRSHEIGIRIALGARPTAVVKLIAHEATVPLIVGLLAGLGCGLGLARFVTSQLFGVEPTDLRSFAIPVACILCSALIATIRPALRAISTDPLSVLRSN